MINNQLLEEGQTLKYTGKGFEHYDKDQPLMKFLGYDSNGWGELWVDYNGQRIPVFITDVEKVK